MRPKHLLWTFWAPCWSLAFCFLQSVNCVFISYNIQLVFMLKYVFIHYGGKVGVKIEVTKRNWIINDMFFHYYLIYVGPSTWQVVINNDLRYFEVLWTLGVVLSPPLWGEMDTQFRRMWDILRCMPCRIPCNNFIHSNLFAFLDPWAIVQSEAG